MSTPAKIVRILSIRDTRQYEEQGDRWVPIPGSGTESQCHRCGRTHEVHATVLLDDGQEVVVGTGCASKDDAEAAKRFKSLDTAAKRLARLQAELCDYGKRLEKWNALWSEVCLLTPPEVKSEPFYKTPPYPANSKAVRYTMGEAWAASHTGELTPERMDCLLTGWLESKMRERGIPHFPRTRTVNITREIERVRRRIEEKRLC